MVHTGLGLQLEVQLVPLMQVFLRLDPAYRGQMCGEAGQGPEGLGPWGQSGTQVAGASRGHRGWQEVGTGGSGSEGTR